MFNPLIRIKNIYSLKKPPQVGRCSVSFINNLVHSITKVAVENILGVLMWINKIIPKFA